MYESLGFMHRATAEHLGPRIALRYKQHGHYHDLSWREYRAAADEAAAALISLGIAPGDRIGILSENRLEWLVADIAILSAGACDVPLHAPLVDRQVAYQLGHSQARGVFVSHQAQADKVFRVLDELPDLEFVVSFEPVAWRGKPRHQTWDGFRQLGRRTADAEFTNVIDRERQVRRHDLATIIYTSGTTGNPKGVMLTHDNLLTNCEAMLAVSVLTADDILLSWLPYSHIYARTVDHYHTILSESTICLAESVDTLITNLWETQPTWMTAVPRFYEKVWALVESLPADERRERLHAIFGPRLRWLSSGGAPLPRHVCEGFWEAGLKLLEGYGLTETSPVISFNRIDCHRIGTVGLAIPGVEVKIAADGEILTRGPHVMKGYWRNEAATAEAIVDGWFHTGDIGTLDADGFLAITDRKKDLLILSSGKNIAPTEIERLLISDPYLDQAILYGDRKHYLVALLVPNFPMLEAQAAEFGCTLDIVDDFVTNPTILAFVKSRVDALMEQVSQPERVKRFRVLGRPLQQERDELTATLKVRRRAIVDRFRDVLESLYTD